MAEIIVSGIEKSFVQDRVVLDDVSFQVDAGERVGLLGPNGAGKTTLLKIITGEITPDKGFIAIPQGRRVGYISQLAEAPEGALVEDSVVMPGATIEPNAIVRNAILGEDSKVCRGAVVGGVFGSKDKKKISVTSKGSVVEANTVLLPGEML